MSRSAATPQVSRLAGALVVVLLVSACPSPEPRPGVVLSADGAAAGRLLAAAARLEGTPLGRAAAVLAEQLAPCSDVAASCPEPDCPLVQRLSCDDGSLAPEDRRAAGVDLLFSRSLGSHGRLLASGTVSSAGALRLDVEVPASLGQEAVGLLLPAAESAGPSVLSSRDALVHARVRPDRGLDLTPFVDDDGWGNRVFRLKSELFLGVALSGVWELAMYLPNEGERVPPVALALDHRDRRRAIQVMESFIDRVLDTWPVRRTPTEGGGACLDDLRVLPELAPCWTPTERALVVGWNARSLQLALSDATTPDPGAGGAARIDFARMPLADARIAAASGAELGRSPRWPWTDLRVEGRRDGDRFHFTLVLETPE